MWEFSQDFDAKGYKFEQVRDGLIKLIEDKSIDVDVPLPSLIEMAELYKLSTVTVSRAYHHLKMKGYIVNVKGKFYVNQEKINRLRVLLVFNKLEDNKKIAFEAIQEVFGGTAKIDLQVYYSNLGSFIEIMNEAIGLYDYYVIMPHFYHGTDLSSLEEVMAKIPDEKLLFIDRKLALANSGCGSVVQDFEGDMFESLVKIKDRILRYNEIRIVLLPPSHHPTETVTAIKSFCEQYGLGFSIVDNLENESLREGMIFIATTDKDLAHLLKKIKNSAYRLGNQIGIIGYNETILKNILDVTVFSSNFHHMGKKVAEMIMNKEFAHETNPFDIILRNTL